MKNELVFFPTFLNLKYSYYNKTVWEFIKKNIIVEIFKTLLLFLVKHD